MGRHLEASVIKTNIPESMLDEHGELDMKKVWNQITWEYVNETES